MFSVQVLETAGIKRISAGLPDGQLLEYVVSDIPYRNGVFLLSREEDMPALGAHIRLTLDTPDQGAPQAFDAIVACRTNQGFGVEIVS